MTITLVVAALTLTGCGSGSDEGAATEDIDAGELLDEWQDREEPSTEPCYSTRTCEGLLPLQLTGPDWDEELDRLMEEIPESDRAALGLDCGPGDTLWQITERRRDLPICAATRDEAVARMEATAEPDETAAPATGVTTTTTEPPPTRDAGASLAGTKWFMPGGFAGLGSDHSRFTFDESGEVLVEFVDCRSEGFCFSWEQDGTDVEIVSHTGSAITYSGTVGPGHIVTGTARKGVIGPGMDVNDFEFWTWGAVWCPHEVVTYRTGDDDDRRDDCGPGAAEELSRYVSSDD